MLINGSPALSCNTQILDISDKAITIAPLPNFDIIKDLVPDLVPMFAVHAKMMPYIKRKDLKEMEVPTREYFQTSHELEQFLQFTYCIKCGACMSACPTMATDRQYPGPMPLAQAYRYTVDTRDDGGSERKDIIAANHGIYGCHYAGECSNVCPKGVEPARAIQLMKKDLVCNYLKLSENKSCAHVNKTKADPKQKVLPPPFTVAIEGSKTI